MTARAASRTEPATPLQFDPQRVVFVYMPWATTYRPSIALGILKQLCRESRVQADTYYANLDIAAMVGFEVAYSLGEERMLFGLSEHLFAVDLFGAEALRSDTFIGSLRPHQARPFSDSGFMELLRDEVVPAFLDRVTARVLEAGPAIVGLSATFNQVMACLALGRRIKEASPETQVIAGGACFDGEMGQEYHRALPEALDHVFMGEAETSFREYLRRRKRGESTSGIPGVTYYEDGEVKLELGQALADLDQSPRPDYDDFFREKDRVERQTGKIFNTDYLLFEGARGCWWGQKAHCVFCGINRDLMHFREKSVDSVIEEIVYLSARYRGVKMMSTDWIISRKNREEIFRRLRDLDLDLEIFYETRSDLSKREIKMMKEAGLSEVQPGIESLSTPILKLMKKGTTAIRQVQFMRWCHEVGVHLTYNLLCGFPGEKAEWYLDMARLIPHILHLQPSPHNMFFVEMHRFAPMYQHRAELGIEHYEIRGDYKFNFPEGMVDPLKVGYFFDFRSSQLAEKDLYLNQTRREIAKWIDAHRQEKPPRYEYTIGPGFLRITDTRFGEGRYIDLAGLHQDVVLLCDQVMGRSSLVRDLAKIYPEEVEDGTLDSVIDELIEANVVMTEGAYLLTLPVGQRVRTTEQLREYVLSVPEPRKRLAVAT